MHGAVQGSVANGTAGTATRRKHRNTMQLLQNLYMLAPIPLKPPTLLHSQTSTGRGVIKVQPQKSCHVPVPTVM